MRLWNFRHPGGLSTGRKFLIGLPPFAYYVLGYFWTNRFNEGRVHYHDLSLPLDHALPFVAEAIWGYYLVIVVVATMFLLVGDEDLLLRSTSGLYVLATISFAIFLALPVQMVGRPVVLPDGTLTTAMTEFFFAVDRPTNLFPSLHVTVSLFAALVLARMGRPWGTFGFAGTGVVMVSVLLVKQHYLADVVGGTLLALGSYGWAFRGAREGAGERSLVPAESRSVPASVGIDEAA